jgi:L-idonate 5-dehydrogenase
METRVRRLHGIHDIRVETESVAEPQAGEVCVCIGGAGICGSNLHYFHEGSFGPIRVREPIVLGHEVAGTVEAGSVPASTPTNPTQQTANYSPFSLRQAA